MIYYLSIIYRHAILKIFLIYLQIQKTYEISTRASNFCFRAANRIFAVFISTMGLRFVRKRYTEEYLKNNHEVGGYFFNAFGLLYAVLIAFVVYVTWTEFDTSSRDIELEANQTYLLYFNASEFPEPSRTEIRNAVKEYISIVINDEWKKLPYG